MPPVTDRTSSNRLLTGKSASQIAVVALHNNDLANFWEWYGQAGYPLRPSTDAFRMGTNFVVHAFTH